MIDDPDNPGEGRSEQEGRAEAAKLLKRMLAAGVSKWHPDPLGALEASACMDHRQLGKL
jgi:hypothetical protein